MIDNKKDALTRLNAMPPNLVEGPRLVKGGDSMIAHRHAESGEFAQHLSAQLGVLGAVLGLLGAVAVVLTAISWAYLW
jgi:hypothetical protein